MSDFKKYILKARIMMIIEIVLIAFTFVIFIVLENIVGGMYLILYIASIFLWVIVFILTVNLYYKAKKIKTD
ncbi:MAG: hypothetical protein HWN80_00355 [Candidatus Lokiarchaeota archaeon]|nr:hypothetical protein [Candidatus Lokiarchaeota archaeon]